MTDSTCQPAACEGGELYEANSMFMRGDFSEYNVGADSVRGRLKGHVSAREELKPTEAVLSIIKEGYKLPLLSIPDLCLAQQQVCHR